MRMKVNIRTSVWENVDRIRWKYEIHSYLNMVLFGIVAIFGYKDIPLLLAGLFGGIMSFLTVMSKNKWDKGQTLMKKQLEDAKKIKEKVKNG